MKKIRVVTIILLCILASNRAESQDLQGPGNGVSGKKETPVLKEISGLEVIKTVYPEAVAIEKSGSVWFKIIDAKRNYIGYALSSKPFSEGIIGYHNTTPVIIITDKNQIIKKVAMLSNWESTGYTRKLERQNFFNNWNGLTVKEAAAKKSASADSYTGATYTASAVVKNVNIVLNKALKSKIQ